LISIRFTGFPDLTVDGSFTLGAALYAVGIKSGYPVALSILIAFVSGCLAGSMTASINKFLKIGKIISSVLVMLFLITVVPYLTGGATVGLLNEKHWLHNLQTWDVAFSRNLLPGLSSSLHVGFIASFLVLCLAITLLIRYFFATRIGVQIRYFGSSVSSNLLSRNQKTLMLFVGLSLGNGLVGFGGAIEAERNGGFSQNMGLGTILIGLAILVLGESIVKTKVRRDNLHVREYLIAVSSGVLVYSFGLQVLLWSGLTFLDVRLTTTVFLLIMLAIAARRHPNSGRLF
jgi:putative ABC transport system permease protein